MSQIVLPEALSGTHTHQLFLRSGGPDGDAPSHLAAIQIEDSIRICSCASPFGATVEARIDERALLTQRSKGPLGATLSDMVKQLIFVFRVRVYIVHC